MILEEAIEVLKNAKYIGSDKYASDFDREMNEAIDTVVAKLDKPTYTERDMHLNMQYYMEYCQMKGYITPMEWLEKHKHF